MSFPSQTRPHVVARSVRHHPTRASSEVPKSRPLAGRTNIVISKVSSKGAAAKLSTCSMRNMDAAEKEPQQTCSEREMQPWPLVFGFATRRDEFESVHCVISSDQ